MNTKPVGEKARTDVLLLNGLKPHSHIKYSNMIYRVAKKKKEQSIL